jgi:hypothetical protein
VKVDKKRRNVLKKMMMVAAMLALVLAVALPAVAQVVQAPTETFVSGTNTNNAGSVQGGGDNSNTCAAQENFNNSGGVLNQPSLQQYASDIGTGVLFLGPAFTNAPSQTAPCAPTVQQAASSSSGT